MSHSTNSSDSHFDPQYAPLARWERVGLASLFIVLLVFGVLVEIRAAFLTRPMTDLGVYLRAAWAVRTGNDFYAVMDDNGWHYHYPPLFAILLVPLADPPFGVDRSGMVPFAVAVAIWYLLSIVCLFAAVHILAHALEQTSPDPAVRFMPVGCRRWWLVRVLPVLACLPPVGHTLMRGQVNLLLLLLLCGMIAAILHGRSWRAGFWLAAAICLKIIPAFLLIYPLWRRDWRFLTACAVGSVLGLLVMPALVLGPAQTWAYYREWDEALRRPALAGGPDQSRAKELIEVTATDSQSYLAIIHNTLHARRAIRPAYPNTAVRGAHWLLGGLFTGITLLAMGWGRRSPEKEVIACGLLVVMMVLLSPVCHLHYLCLVVPLLMVFVARLWDGAAPNPPWGWYGLFAVNFIANSLPHFPRLEYLRDFGLATYATLLLWLAGVVVLWRSSHGHAGGAQAPHEVRAAA